MTVGIFQTNLISSQKGPPPSALKVATLEIEKTNSPFFFFQGVMSCSQKLAEIEETTPINW